MSLSKGTDTAQGTQPCAGGVGGPG